MPFPFRLLPALIFVGAMMLSVKIGDIWQGIAAIDGGVELRQAQSAESTPAPPNAAGGAADAAADRGGDGKGAENAGPAPVARPAPAAGTQQRSAAAPPEEEDMADPDQLSRSEIQLLQQLSKRRDLLDRRARRLNQRESLLKAAEQKLMDRQAELASIRSEIKKLLGDLDDKEKKRIANLVKIYETMKPKSAARIFDELDMTVLLGVMERMKARKVAPVIAAMKPSRAREVTGALSRRKVKGSAAPAPPPLPGGS
jgi:flagellar motility protein MotE (MotC chaperone)